MQHSDGFTTRLTRRRALGALAVAGLVPGAALAQATPDASPAATPAASPVASPAASPVATPDATAVPSVPRSTASWFVTSAPPGPEDSQVTADLFEVWDGATRQKLGGFRAPGVSEFCLTSDPAKVLLSTGTEISIFDLTTGKVTPVDFGDAVGPALWLPDARVFSATPPRWSFVRTMDYAHAWLIDLETATATDLAGIVGPATSFQDIAFSADGALAALIDVNGAAVFEPTNPAGAQILTGGITGGISGRPDFSFDNAYAVYSIVTADSDDATIVVEELATRTIVATIGGVSPLAWAVFMPDTATELLIMGDGEVSRQAIDTGREAWAVRTHEIAFGYGYVGDGSELLIGTNDTYGSQDVYWSTISLADGTETVLDDLEGLTFYNASYPTTDGTYTLFGAPYVGADEETTDVLVGLNGETNTIVPLLDNASSWELSYGYATSENGGIAIFVDYDAYVMNLETGEVRVYPDFDTGWNSHESFVSPDGSTAAIAAIEDDGSPSIYLIDVAGGGDPELFQAGKIWMWAGSTTGGPIARSGGGAARASVRVHPRQRFV